MRERVGVCVRVLRAGYGREGASLWEGRCGVPIARNALILSFKELLLTSCEIVRYTKSGGGNGPGRA